MVNLQILGYKPCGTNLTVQTSWYKPRGSKTSRYKPYGTNLAVQTSRFKSRGTNLAVKTSWCKPRSSKLGTNLTTHNTNFGTNLNLMVQTSVQTLQYKPRGTNLGTNLESKLFIEKKYVSIESISLGYSF